MIKIDVPEMPRNVLLALINYTILRGGYFYTEECNRNKDGFLLIPTRYRDATVLRNVSPVTGLYKLFVRRMFSRPLLTE